MPHDPHLADQMRDALEGRAGITEKAMFGGFCWMLHGNMLCGVEVGRYMFRVGKPREPEALTHEGTEGIAFNGRRMGGIIWVDAEAAEEAGLTFWIDFAAVFVGGLPPK